jgi:hypothetical protein
MDALIIEMDQLVLDPEIVTAIREELVAGGLCNGVFTIGSIYRLPDTIYVLWRRSAEIPVSTTFPLSALSHPMLARVAAQEFLMKWTQVID